MTRGERWAARINELAGTCTDAAGGLAVLPGGTRLAIGHADGTLRCVELATGDAVWFGAERHAPVLQSLAGSPDGRLLATVADDSTIRVWDAATGAALACHALPAIAFELRFSPDGARLATAGADDRVGVYRVDGGERLALCTGHEAWVQSVDWSPRGDRLASVSNDATLRIWDAASCAELERRELGARAQAVAWSPSGSWLAVGLEGGDVVLLDAAGPFAEAHRLRADPDGVHGLAWDASGRLLAIAGEQAVAIWEAGSGDALARFPHGAPYAHRVAWAPDGTFVAASLCGDRVRLWETRS
jgi:WD40 repeat protein